MKITEEWINERIDKCKKNIEFCKNKVWKEFTEKYEWELCVWYEVLFRKMQSNRSCVLFDKAVPMWKRHIIRTLKHFCDWLEGVENPGIFKRDILEKRSDAGHKRYLRYKK